MQDGHRGVDRTQRRPPSDHAFSDQRAGGIDVVVTHGPPRHHDVGLDDVVAQNGSKFIVPFHQFTDLRQVPELGEFANVLADGELPLAGPQMTQIRERGLQIFLGGALEHSACCLTGQPPDDRFSPDLLENPQRDPLARLTATIGVVRHARVVGPQDPLDDVPVIGPSQLGHPVCVRHCRSSPITCSSCIRCSICDPRERPQRAGIIRRSRSRRRTPISTRSKPTASANAARQVGVSTSMPRSTEVPTTTMTAPPFRTTRCISRRTAVISRK